MTCSPTIDLVRPSPLNASGKRVRHTALPSAVFIWLLFAGHTDATAQDDVGPASKPMERVSFDLNLLKSRGITPEMVEHLRQAARFAAGMRRVSLQVNGNPRGRVDAQFDPQGQLCFNSTLLDQAGLKTPDPQFLKDGCYDFIAGFPQTVVTLIPAREEVALVVSSDTLRSLADDTGQYQQGGVGGLINYDLLGQWNTFSGTRQEYYALNTELGLNVNDWIVRSRQSHTVQAERRTSQTLYTYAQKSFTERKALVQAGQISIRNSAISGAAITGLQVLPESALVNNTRRGATVEGIAQSQARVEVRQSGALIHSTLVPPGPFTLPDIQLLNNTTDLDVQVIEADGQSRSFTVPAASLAQFNSSVPGYSFAAGRVRTFDNKAMQSPLVATGSGGWLLSPRNLLSAGAMVSDNDYQALGWSLGSQLTPDTSLNVRNTLTHAGQQNSRGGEASASLSMKLTEQLGASVNATRRTAGYRDLMETTQTTKASQHQKARNAAMDQYGVGLSWSNPLLGGFSVGYSAAMPAQGNKSEHLNTAWGKAFEHLSVNARVEHTLGRAEQSRHSRGASRSARDDTALYLSVSVPLGNSRSVRSYANRRSGVTRLGASYNDNSNEFVGYSLSSERKLQDKRDDFSASVNVLPRYTSMNLGYSQSGNDSTNYTGQLRGGVALHGAGVTFSPYDLADTFAVATVADTPGVRLNTPSGPVWTDGAGRAVVAKVPAYQKSNVEITTKSLPRNLDIQNGYKTVMAGRGSVQTLDFSVVRSRRVLLTIVDEKGAKLSKGLPVYDDTGAFVTTVVEGGKAFITNHALGKRLTVRTTNGGTCGLDFSLPEATDLEVYYEKAQAVCAPSDYAHQGETA